MTKAKTNQYEELIDVMMILEVAGLDTNLKQQLEGLSTAKKRIGILSLLDKDRGLFMKVHNVIKNTQVSKSEHIKNVVEMLRDYVKVGLTEQRKFAEVFTKYVTVNEMLDLVNKDDWSNPNLRFLDNSCGVGNFPIIIIERLMDGLKNWEKDEEKRYKYIVENMIYMCELQSKNAFLVLVATDPQDEYTINIYNGSFLDEGFDSHMQDVWGVEGFDYVIQNPPYQEELVTKKGSAKPLYNLFIEKSLKLSEQVISIHPSRWMGGGKGLDGFRAMMLNRVDVKEIRHFADARLIFGNDVEIKGGVQILHINKSYNGLTNYNGILCNLNNFDIFVEPKNRELINKIEKYEGLDSICHGQSYCGITSNDSRLKDVKEDGDIKCFVSIQKGVTKYINQTSLKVIPTLKKYKVFTSRAYNAGIAFSPYFYVGEPNDVCSQSYVAFVVNGKLESDSLISYLKTKFANKLLSLRKISQDIKPDTCKWIPLVPFDRKWTDEMLFEYFELNKEEQELILNK